MKKTTPITVIIAAILIAGAYFLLKGGSFTSKQLIPSPEITLSPLEEEKKEVTIQAFAFSPETITVKINTEIVWTNEDSLPHKIIIDFGGGSKIEGKALERGEKYSLIFREKREYDYYCGFNPSMKGKIVVVE